MTDSDLCDPGAPLLADLQRFQPDGMSLNAWAVLAGVNRSVWTDIRRHGNPSRRTLERLLRAAGSSLAEFEALRVGEPSAAPAAAGDGTIGDRAAGAWRGAAVPPLPRRASDPLDDWPTAGWTCLRVGGVVSGSALPRPSSVMSDRQAYAIAAVDDAMWPRFAEGAMLVVSPAMAVGVGDDVLLHLHEPSGRAMLKRMVAMAPDRLTLRQFAPDRTMVLPRDRVERIERVVGEAI